MCSCSAEAQDDLLLLNQANEIRYVHLDHATWEVGDVDHVISCGRRTQGLMHAFEPILTRLDHG